MNAKIYWISTSLVALMMLFSSYTYFFQDETITGVRELGFPDYFRIQLGVLKIVGTIVLIYPGFPLLVKEWSYAGIALFFLTAIVAHTAHGDPVALSLVSVFFLALLAVSHLTLYRMRS